MIGQVLDVKPDNSKEPLEHDKYVMDIFKSIKYEETLVEYKIIKISSILNHSQNMTEPK